MKCEKVGGTTAQRAREEQRWVFACLYLRGFDDSGGFESFRPWGGFGRLRTPIFSFTKTGVTRSGGLPLGLYASSPVLSPSPLPYFCLCFHPRYFHLHFGLTFPPAEPPLSLPLPTPRPAHTRPAHVSWSIGAPAAPFGAHRIALADNTAGKDVGMWFGGGSVEVDIHFSFFSLLPPHSYLSSRS
jgi:hypothetical protein